MPYSVEEREANGCPFSEVIFWEEGWKHGLYPNNEDEIIQNMEEIFYQPITDVGVPF